MRLLRIVKLWALIGCLITSSGLSADYEADFERLHKQKWTLIETANFKILTDAKPKMAAEVVSDLEAYHHIYKTAFQAVDTPLPKLTILAVEHRKSFEALGLAERTAGFFRYGGHTQPVAVANITDYKGATRRKPNFAKSILMHEYVHFLDHLKNRSVRMPYWFVEGRAEYLGTFRYDQKAAYFGDISGLESRIYGLYSANGQMQINSREIFALTRESIAQAKPSQNTHAGYYARAGFIYHYFNSSEALRKQLSTLVNLQVQGAGADALNQATGLTYQEFDLAVADYLTKALQMRVISLEDPRFRLPQMSPVTIKPSAAEVEKMLTETFRFTKKPTEKK